MSINSDLRKLRMKRAGTAYLSEYFKQIDARTNDRGAAILAATFLENGMEYAVSRRLPGSPKMFSELYDNNGLLSSFDAKISISEALEIYGPITKLNIHTVKHVRNTFAHASVPIDFQTPEIAAACNTLQLPSQDPQRYRKVLLFSTPREKFTTICEVTGTALFNYASQCANWNSDFISANFKGRMIPVAPGPLP